MNRSSNRRTLIVTALLCAVAPSWTASAAPRPGKELRVVTTLPDLQDLVERIGGDRVEVTSICRGRENIHTVPARPSQLVALSRADLFVQIGLALEASFVPNLLLTARNERIQAGAEGFVNCSDGWEAIQVPSQVSRQGGDLHPFGNPHMNLSPRAGRHMAERILAGLERVDPDGAEVYRRNHEAWLEELEPAEKRWAEQGAAWKDRKVVIYHQEYDYLAAVYGIEVVGKVEIKPGIPPTPNHIASLLETMKREEVEVILTAPWSNNRYVEDLAERTGAQVLELPGMCGAEPGTESWIGMMEHIHRELGQAFERRDEGR